MVTIAILAILAALAAPSFSPIIERYRTRQVAENLQSTLYYARSEAIKRGSGITIEFNSTGWDVKAGADVLQTSTSPNNVTVASTGPLTADRWGILTDSTPGTTFKIQVTPTGGSANNGRTVCIKTGGLIKSEPGATSC